MNNSNEDYAVFLSNEEDIKAVIKAFYDDPLGGYRTTHVFRPYLLGRRFTSHAMHVHNCTRHTTTKQKPTRILFGFESGIPVKLRRQPELLSNHADYKKVLEYQLQESHDFDRKNLIDLKKYVKRLLYGKDACNRTFPPGQFVWLKKKEQIFSGLGRFI